ncbi:MAG: hypothetical protein V1492_00010 [Candidatus Micrarchaeota archaeon]
MKRLVILALLLSIGFFGFGCIEPPTNQTINTTNITTTPTIVVLFYDPAGGGMEEQLAARTKAHLPNVQLELKCSDFTKLVYNQSSESEQTCVLKDGQAIYDANMQALQQQLENGASSPIFVVSDGKYTQVIPTIHPLGMAKAICAVQNFPDCASLPAATPLKATLYAVNESDALFFTSFITSLGKSGVQVDSTTKIADAADKSTLNTQTGAKFLPVMMTENADSDTQFVLDLFVEQMASGQAPLSGKKLGSAYAFFVPSGSAAYYMGNDPFVNAVAYVPVGQEAAFAGVFDGFSAAGVLLNVSYVGANATTAAALANESGELFLPILVISADSLTAGQQTALDALVSKPVAGSVTLYMKKVNGKYYGYTSLSNPELYAGGKLKNVTLDLFIMSHCPYGTQMQKAFIPVVELFNGTGKLTVNNKFVSYTMHGDQEVTDNLIEYCVGQKASVKQWPFLRCFVESNGDSNLCMASLGISKPEIDACAANARTQFNVAGTNFPIYAQENTKYGVQGSPTVVFAGKQMSMERNSEAIKEFVCGLLESPPAACNNTLSTANAGAGFGLVNSTGTTGSTASCG